MKATVILILSLLTIFFISQAFIFKSVNEIETHKYQVVKNFKNFEIRNYDATTYSYVILDSKSYKESSSEGFRTLAGYIFGKNDKEQNIAMTSPVTMIMGDSITMMFKIPSEYSIEDLPRPDNSSVMFKKEGKKTVAAISFSGWANDEKIKSHVNLLKELLFLNQIEHNNEFSFLGYNPPFEVLNRRNEVIVEVKYD